MGHDIIEADQRATAEEFIALNEKRAQTYALLARIFRVELDNAVLESMRGMRFPLESGNDKADKGAKLLVDALSNLWENSLTDFAVDYARIFLGNGIDSYSAAYPYESVYTSPKRLLMQDARNEVVAIYRSEGLDKDGGWTEGEDHVALEFEFMQTMVERLVIALKSGDDLSAARLLKVQANFLDAHLSNWLPMLTSDMRRFARSKLYSGLSYYAEGFLEVECAFLADIMAENDEAFA